ncbi:hypothetical protein NDU88_001602 [Pleurodeles waltl]|uniref:Uncharacterized protein n=1 Tax=Pleurodeles waltl TaxID=8319 RepID=A0AAV7R7L5_PLEWA|nr:hypothetical protein NDU88_001602 [Pleurodeles waltl]
MGPACPLLKQWTRGPLSGKCSATARERGSVGLVSPQQGDDTRQRCMAVEPPPLESLTVPGVARWGPGEPGQGVLGSQDGGSWVLLPSIEAVGPWPLKRGVQRCNRRKGLGGTDRPAAG